MAKGDGAFAPSPSDLVLISGHQSAERSQLVHFDHFLRFTHHDGEIGIIQDDHFIIVIILADLALDGATGLGLDPIQFLFHLDRPEGLVQVAGGQGAGVAVEHAVDATGADLADLLVADHIEADGPFDHVVVDGADFGFVHHGWFLRYFVAAWVCF
jgi:hypothetical protein